MKVTGVKVTPYAFPPAGKPAGRHATSGSIVELMTDSGLTGIAIGADGAHTQIERLVGEMLVGADPRATSGLWRQMTDALSVLARAQVAHGDLSPYNTLVHRGRLVLIDLPQIVDVVANPQGAEFIARDVRNVANWFNARGHRVDPDELIERLLYEAGLR